MMTIKLSNPTDDKNTQTDSLYIGYVNIDDLSTENNMSFSN